MGLAWIKSSRGLHPDDESWGQLLSSNRLRERFFQKVYLAHWDVRSVKCCGDKPRCVHVSLSLSLSLCLSTLPLSHSHCSL